MAPKKKGGGSSLKKSLEGSSGSARSMSPGTAKNAKGRNKNQTPSGRADVQLIQQLHKGSHPLDIQQMLLLLPKAQKKPDIELLRAACAKCKDLCETDEGMWNFLGAEAVEPFLSVKQTAVAGIPALVNDATGAVDAVFSRSLAWLEEVDEVDFYELPNVMRLATSVAALNQDVAVGVLLAMQRFAAHRPEHRTAMIEANALQTMHVLLATHRLPEFVHETITTLYHITDIPTDKYLQQLIEEIGLIHTIVESLDQAPFNLRLQMAGMRLLALWMQDKEHEFVDAEKKLAECGTGREGQDQDADNYFENDAKVQILERWKEVRNAGIDAGAQATLQKAVSNLASAGLTHASSWIDTIGKCIDPEGKGKPKKGEEKLGGSDDGSQLSDNA